MAQSKIHVLYWMGYAPAYAPSPEFDAWTEKIRAAFAEIGWNLTYNYDPMSSTDQDGYYLGIESDGGPLERATLEKVLVSVGIENGGWCNGDIIEPPKSGASP